MNPLYERITISVETSIEAEALSRLLFELGYEDARVWCTEDFHIIELDLADELDEVRALVSANLNT